MIGGRLALFAAMGCAAVLVISAGLAAEERSPAAQSPPLAGLIETATIFPGGFKLKAKLDTGARTSSLGAHDIQLFTRKGKDMVRFTVWLPDRSERVMERRLYRLANIKERNGGTTRRPVVLLSVCIGNLLRQTQVNLQNRENFLYTLLIGRRFLSGVYVVDPGRRNLLRTDCPAAENKKSGGNDE